MCDPERNKKSHFFWTHNQQPVLHWSLLAGVRRMWKRASTQSQCTTKRLPAPRRPRPRSPVLASRVHAIGEALHAACWHSDCVCYSFYFLGSAFFYIQFIVLTSKVTHFCCIFFCFRFCIASFFLFCAHLNGTTVVFFCRVYLVHFSRTDSCALLCQR